MNKYEISFEGNGEETGFYIELPESFASKRLSLSAGSVDGEGAAVEIRSYSSSGAIINNVSLSHSGRIEDIRIHSNTAKTRLYVLSKTKQGHVRFKDIQLEVGIVTTPFREYKEDVTSLNEWRPVANVLPSIEKFDSIWGSGNVSFDGESWRVEFTGEGNCGVLNRNYPFSSKVGRTYTLSYYARANRDGVSLNYVYFMGSHYTGANKNVGQRTLTTSWQRYEVTSTYDYESDNASILIAGRVGSGGNSIGDWFEVKDIQLELGESATEYQPLRMGHVPKKSRLELNGDGRYGNTFVEKGLSFTRESQYVESENQISFNEAEMDLKPIDIPASYGTFFILGQQSTSSPFLWLYADKDWYLKLQVSEKDGSYKAISIPFLVNPEERIKIGVLVEKDYVSVLVDEEEIFRYAIKGSIPQSSLRLMTYSKDRHMLKGTLYSFTARMNGRTVVSYNTENLGNLTGYLVDRSGKDNHGKVYNSPVMNLHVPKDKVRKSYRKYNFEFTRESSELIDGILTGLNQPRINNHGIVIQEETVNLLPYDFSINGGGSAFVDTSIFNKERRRLRRLERKSTTNAHVVTSIPCKPSTWYTYSVYARLIKGDEDTHFDIYLSDNTTSSHQYQRVNLSNEFQRHVIHHKTSSTANFITRAGMHFGTNRVKVGDIIEIADWQVEERDYATDFSEGIRPMEKMNVPVELDGQGGSLQIDFEHKEVYDQKMYLFDSDRRRWLLWKPAGADYFQLYTDGGSRLSFNVSHLKQGRNSVLIEWGKSSVSLKLNGEVRATGTHTGGANNTYLTIGRRQNDIDFYNTIIYDVVIKDRTGKTVFKL